MAGDQLDQQLMRWVAALDKQLGSLTPREGLDIMMSLFGEAPAGSELTYMSSLAREPHPGHVHLRVALWTPLTERQTSFVSGEEQDSQSVRVRSLVFAIPAGEGDRHPESLQWCNDPADLASFSAAVADSGPYVRWAGWHPRGVGWLDEHHRSWLEPSAFPPDFLESDAKFHPHARWLEQIGRDAALQPPARIDLGEPDWLDSSDATKMLQWLRQERPGGGNALHRLLARYFLACCRRIWRLLPHPDSRRGVEFGEQLLEGRIQKDAWREVEIWVEGAALEFDYDGIPEISRWCREVAHLPDESLMPLLHRPRTGRLLLPRGLLFEAAYFAHAAMSYPTKTFETSLDRYAIFLPAPLLREFVGNPFRSRPDALRLRSDGQPDRPGA